MPPWLLPAVCRLLSPGTCASGLLWDWEWQVGAATSERHGNGHPWPPPPAPADISNPHRRQHSKGFQQPASTSSVAVQGETDSWCFTFCFSVIVRPGDVPALLCCNQRVARSSMCLVQKLHRTFCVPGTHSCRSQFWLEDVFLQGRQTC